ncbi:hypothetical protein GF345_03790 [Candidatus Woesearchaeota archaeon]|nr:hypothetical protein [Candidatus Woesearchaeota archaeon]
MAHYTIYCDLHTGAPHEIPLDEFTFTKNTVFLGDNFDLKNCLKTDLEAIIAKRQDVMERCRRTGGIYVTGNHSLDDNHLYDTRDGILFMHGDLAINHSAKRNTSRRMGRSRIAWSYLKIYYAVVPDSIPVFNSLLRKAYALAEENDCHTILMGHFHPMRMIEKDYKGKRIIIMPRGKNEISI